MLRKRKKSYFLWRMNTSELRYFPSTPLFKREINQLLWNTVLFKYTHRLVCTMRKKPFILRFHWLSWKWLAIGFFLWECSVQSIEQVYNKCEKRSYNTYSYSKTSSFWYQLVSNILLLLKYSCRRYFASLTHYHIYLSERKAIRSIETCFFFQSIHCIKSAAQV